MEARAPASAPDGRIAPLRRLLAPVQRAAAMGATLLGPRTLDPRRAWDGRITLDRARVDSRPDDADAWWRLAQGLEATGRLDAAAAAFLRAFRLDLTPHPEERPRSRALLVTPGRHDLDLVLDLAGDLGRRHGSPRLPFAWITTEPVAFSSIRDALGERGGRAYRLDPDVLGVLLRDTPLPVVGAAFALAADPLDPLPRSIPRVRLPRRWTEGPCGGSFAAVLCPSRPMHDRWSRLGADPYATGSARTIPVSWPAHAPHPAVATRPVAEVVVVAGAPAGSSEAWSADTWIELLRGLLVELPDARIAVRIGAGRHQEFASRWRVDIGADRAWQRRVRIELSDRGPIVGAQCVVVEAHEETVARHLHAAAGPPLIVFAPRSTSREWMGLRVADTGLRVVAALHDSSRDPRSATRRRDAARRACFFLDASTDSGALPAVDAMRALLDGGCGVRE